MVFNYRNDLKRLGRDLRNNQTDAERLLWSKIRKKQLKNLQFNRQKPIGKYIVDFYCDEAKLVVEIDGGQHFEDENIKLDKYRDSYLKSIGLKVLRFNNFEVLKNIDGVLNKIYSEI